eukprot:Protomagalhaensia_wolfi_Nauph_80__1288@NODE_1763_length_1355_cov_120_715805_g1371_i0_p1_GENE_NODE_1763_length_1355_cov_120_715805_g1371_i0NODE_1763_length_1355_cov_120_715805_g1371_i0_p1_ORF_typecomplete_len240_score10_71_NODE_1763_length_1355_cov_120_715805_g1371_i05551274
MLVVFLSLSLILHLAQSAQRFQLTGFECDWECCSSNELCQTGKPQDLDMCMDHLGPGCVVHELWNWTVSEGSFCVEPPRQTQWQTTFNARLFEYEPPEEDMYLHSDFDIYNVESDCDEFITIAVPLDKPNWCTWTVDESALLTKPFTASISGPFTNRHISIPIRNGTSHLVPPFALLITPLGTSDCQLQRESSWFGTGMFRRDRKRPSISFKLRINETVSRLTNTFCPSYEEVFWNPPT